MQLGISSYSFPWAVGLESAASIKAPGFMELVQYAYDHKINYVQFGDNLPLHQLTTQELEKLKAYADACGIKIQVGARKLIKAHMLTYLSIAVQVGSPFIRVVIDDWEYEPNEKEVIATIWELLPELKKNHIVLAIENHDRFPAASLARIIRQTDSEFVGICLDTANSLGAGEGLREVIDVLGMFTVNLHIKDFNIQRVSHKMGFTITGAAAGEGMLDISWLLDEMKKYTKCETAILELWSDAEVTIEETLAKEKYWVEKSINHLKKIIS